jgi:hypothetical protein
MRYEAVMGFFVVRQKSAGSGMTTQKRWERHCHCLERWRCMSAFY